MSDDRATPTIRTGTSGFSYKEWKGAFYPDDLKAADMLPYYAERLPACEINNTFYRMPSDSTLEGWAAQVPESFRFVLKANKQITHVKRLKEEAAEPLAHFAKIAATLGARQGPTLVQLPPNMKVDVGRLRAFLAAVPEAVRPAFEFRHESWHDDAVYDTLAERDAALVIADTDDLSTPRRATASWGYLRLRRVEYDERDVSDWVAWTNAQPWSEAYVFFKHEDGATGPRLATRFLELARS